MGVRPLDLLRFVQERPFRPFRLTLTDGRTMDIHHPELVIVGQSTAAIGIPSPRYAEPVSDRLVEVSLLHVMQLEHLPEANAG